MSFQLSGLVFVILFCVGCLGIPMGERNGYWQAKRDVEVHEIEPALVEVLETTGMLTRKAGQLRAERIADVQQNIPYNHDLAQQDPWYHDTFWAQARIELQDIQEDLAFMKALAVYLGERLGYQSVDIPGAMVLIDAATEIVAQKKAGHVPD